MGKSKMVVVNADARGRSVGNFPYRCESCGRVDILNPGTHETVQHDGAQTCWPVQEAAV